MNIKDKKTMYTSIISAILITVGAVLLVLGSIPMKNTIEDNKLTVNFIIGKKVVDMTGAEFLPVPDDVNRNIIRVNGTSIGKKHSGRYKNIKTKNKYTFYLTGKGDRVHFIIGETKYLIDGIDASRL